MKRSVLYAISMASILTLSAFTPGTAQESGGIKSECIYQADTSTVKIQGRWFIKNNTLYIPHSASAIEFTATSKSLVINLTGDTTARVINGNIPTNLARYALYVDQQLVETGSMDKQKKNLTVYSGEETRTAHIRLVKLTESAQSVFGIKNIITDSEGSISPEPAKGLKMEFIGDSITCGYGVEAQNQFQSFTTQTQNAEKSYAYLTAKALNADYSLVSYSGHGIYSGYTNGDRNTASLVPPLYEKICFTYSNPTFGSAKWDFSNFQPDIIVVNLGTNDASWCKDSERKEAYTAAYVDFISTIRKNNPGSYIILTLGVMGDELYSSVTEAAELYSAKTNDTQISCLHLNPQNSAADGIGADWHPSAKTQEKKARELVSYIQSLIENQIISVTLEP